MVAISRAEYNTRTTDAPAPTTGYEILYPYDDASTSGRQWRVRDDTEVIVAILKHNYSASTAPTTGDDVGDGYSVGSLWVDTTNDNAYQCVDNTSTAAVWVQIDGSGSIGGSTGATDNAIIRADGTGGSTVQSSGASIDDSGNLTANSLTPTNPIAHEYGGLEADVSSYAGVPIVESGSTTELKINRSATTAPTTGNDNTEGYSVGSLWIDTTNDNAYICEDASTGAAVWAQIDGAGGGASQLSDLSDVNTSSATNRNVLVADGVDFESRALEAADIQSGTLLHERGGLEADVSAYSGLVKISGGATSQAVENTDYAGATHASRHLTGGADEIDGDKLDIDYTPSNYTPSTTPTEADNADNLTAHLYGIDQALAGSGSVALVSDSYQRTSGDYTTTSTTFVQVDGTNLNFSDTFNGGGILQIFATGAISAVGSTGRFITFDIEIDGTSISGGNGIWAAELATGLDNRQGMSISHITTVSAGVHTIELLWKTDGGEARISGSAPVFEMSYVEIS